VTATNLPNKYENCPNLVLLKSICSFAFWKSYTSN